MSDKSNKTDNSSKYTSISLTKDNYARLKALGYTGETFNTVLGKILDNIYSTKTEQED